MGGRVVQGEEVATAGCAAGEVAANPYLLSTNPLMLATGERRSKLSLQAIQPRQRPGLRVATTLIHLRHGLAHAWID